MNPSHFFFFNDTATTEIYTLSLHDALPISRRATAERASDARHRGRAQRAAVSDPPEALDARPQDALRRLLRSEEHTSELQSQSNLVCRLLLDKKKGIAPNQAFFRLLHIEQR